MAEGKTEQQIAEEKAAAAAKRLDDLEALVTKTQEQLRDVTQESITRKEKIRELEADKLERIEQEKQAKEAKEAERVKALPDLERQALERESKLMEVFNSTVQGLNSKIDGLTSSIESKSKETVEREKQAAVEAVVAKFPFHDPGDVQKQIDLADMPMVNGTPDRAWIEAKAKAVAEAKPYLLKPATTSIPPWGGTNAPTTETPPAPLTQEMTPESRGVALNKLSEQDPGAAVLQAILGAVPLPDGATKNALSSPKL